MFKKRGLESMKVSLGSQTKISVKFLFLPVLALLLVLSGCGSGQSSDGTKDVGDCTNIGEIIESGDGFAICLSIDGGPKYLVSGPAIEDIKLLAGINWLDFFLSDEGRSLIKEDRFTYDDFASIDVQTLNLKRFIADKPEWKGVAALILAEEEAYSELKQVEMEYCPQLIDNPDAFCAPKIMSDEGSAKWFEASDYWNAKWENLEKELELIGVFIEGKYQIDGLTAARFAIQQNN
jgi:hypothetical protein